MVTGHPPKVIWVATCRDCAHGSLVKDFDDQADRNQWSRQHFIITGHRVYHTHRPALTTQEEYPT